MQESHQQATQKINELETLREEYCNYKSLAEKKCSDAEIEVLSAKQATDEAHKTIHEKNTAIEELHQEIAKEKLNTEKLQAQIHLMEITAEKMKKAMTVMIVDIDKQILQSKEEPETNTENLNNDLLPDMPPAPINNKINTVNTPQNVIKMFPNEQQKEMKKFSLSKLLSRASSFF